MGNSISRGLRNHNPGNLEGGAWDGVVGKDGPYLVFDTDAHGLRALAKQLLVYQDAHDLRTIAGIITRWAPPSENDTTSYIAAVSATTGFGDKDVLNLHDETTLDKLVTAIIRHENSGAIPYTQAQLMDAVDAALGEAPHIVTQDVPDSGATVPVPSTRGPTMGVALTLLPLLAQFIPQIMTLIKPGSASTAKDAAVAQTILNTAVTAAGVLLPDGQQATAQHVGAAVDAMNADPALAKRVQEAVVTQPEIMQALVIEVGTGGIAAARTANAAPDQTPFYKNPGFIMALVLAPLIYMVVYKTMWDAGFSEQLKTVVVTAVLSGLLGSLTGFYFGSSLRQQAVDAKAEK